MTDITNITAGLELARKLLNDDRAAFVERNLVPEAGLSADDQAIADDYTAAIAAVTGAAAELQRLRELGGAGPDDGITAMTERVIRERDELSAEWRPIAEAPRDGAIVMVYPPTWSGAASCAKWDGDIYSKRPKPYWRRLDDGSRMSLNRSNPPTHWRPVPPGPDGHDALHLAAKGE